LLLTGRQREEKEIYFELLKSNSTATIKLSETELMVAAQLEAAERARNSTIEEQIALQEQLAKTIESSMENALMSMVDGTKSVKDAFKSMAAEIIKELYRVLVVQRIVGSASAGTGIAGSIATLFSANGNAFSGGNILPFANGGVVGGPTMFPVSGGKTGLMGEAGPEAIMPLKRDKNGRLGVSVEGGSGSVVVNNNINVTGGSDPAAIRMEVAKLMPQITSATKAAVIDARRRGGQMRAAFSS
jgi:phage-related minor tail protein